MSPDEVREIRRELAEVRTDVARMVQLQREANGRLGKLEGRTFELELWRARMQGIVATSRVVWLLAGGAVTGIVVSLFNNL